MCSVCFLCYKVIIKSPFYSHQRNYPFHFHSTGMESAIILNLFKRSVVQHGLKYHKFVEDGDSDTEHLLSSTPVYNDVVIRKIECKNHHRISSMANQLVLVFYSNFLINKNLSHFLFLLFSRFRLQNITRKLY